MRLETIYHYIIILSDYCEICVHINNYIDLFQNIEIIYYVNRCMQWELLYPTFSYHKFHSIDM